MGLVYYCHWPVRRRLVVRIYTSDGVLQGIGEDVLCIGKLRWVRIEAFVEHRRLAHSSAIGIVRCIVWVALVRFPEVPRYSSWKSELPHRNASCEAVGVLTGWETSYQHILHLCNGS